MHSTVKIYAQSEWYECALVRSPNDPRAPRLFRRRLLQVDPASAEAARAALSRVAEVRHRGITPLYDYAVSGGTVDALHADAGGSSLRALVERGDFALESLLGAVRDAALALSEVAEQTGLQHGALRPTKLRLQRTGEVAVVGFGIDNLVDAHLLKNGTLPPGFSLFRPDGAHIERSVAGDAFALSRIIGSLYASCPPQSPGLERAVSRWLSESPPGTTKQLAERIAELLRPSSPEPAKGPDLGGLFDVMALMGEPPAREQPPRRPTAVMGAEPSAEPAFGPDQTDEMRAPEEEPTRTGQELTNIGEAKTKLYAPDDGPPGGARTTLARPPPASPAPAPTPERADSLDGERLLGSTVHGYLLVELLASGSYGHVFRGVHGLLGHERAVKVIRAKYAGVEAVRRRLTREAEGLLSLHHENLVGVQDLGLLSDGRPFFVMELLRGQTLAEVLRSTGPLHTDEARAIVRQIARGLAALHAKGIVHRDLKPANLMLVNEAGRMRVKILDLGVARVATEVDRTQLTRPFELVGTPAFMAPEQIETPSAAGPAADQYALGAIWFTMLTGAPPFIGDAYDVLQRARSEIPRQLEGPDGLLIAKLLSKAPEARFRDLAELTSIVDPTATPAPSPAPTQLITPAPRPRLRLSWLGIPLLLAAGIVIGLYLGGRFEPVTVKVPPVSSPPPTASTSPPRPSPTLAVVPAAVTSTPAPPPTPEPAPTAEKPGKEVPIAPRPRRSPSGGPSATAHDGRGAVLAWLAAHQLRREDVALLLPGAGNDLSTPGLLGRLSETPLSAEFLRKRFDRVLQKLRGASAGLAIEDIAPLEERYIQLRKRATPAADPVPLNAELDRLETDLERAR